MADSFTSEKAGSFEPKVPVKLNAPLNTPYTLAELSEHDGKQWSTAHCRRKSPNQCDGVMGLCRLVTMT